MTAAVVVLASRWPLALNDIDLIYLMIGVLALAVLGREIADHAGPRTEHKQTEGE